MIGFSLRALLALAALMIVSVSTGSAGVAKYWTMDARCIGTGGSGSHTRVGRSLRNNDSSWGSSQSTNSYFVFNENSNTCDTHYGEFPKHPNFFRTKNECDMFCRNVYHSLGGVP
ncbi:hypothetical protein TKK_0012570 [Trichogramma kaykai]|uniref:BPTI/Kunitz inhibitor domain-containing protein n=1 Tax=Trichogramma kaykai TaxID=54128 RepID=A0ABD2WMH0_9HYME